MDSLNSVRMEVEETELDFYLVKSGEEWISMTVLLDTIFHRFETYPEHPMNEEVEEAIRLINTWIHFKRKEPLPPYRNFAS